MSKQRLMTSPVLVWFQEGFRLKDNPALFEAASLGKPVIPIYIATNTSDKPWAIEGAARVWLEQSLKCLQQDLQQAGSNLLIRQGDPVAVFSELAQSTGCQHVYYNKQYEPFAQKQYKILEQSLPNLQFKAFQANLLISPDTLLNQSGKPYQVFTPFWRRCLEQAHEWCDPLPPPTVIPPPEHWPKTLCIEDLKLTTGATWEQRLCSHWQVGERQALKQLNRFAETKVAHYGHDRDSLWPEDASSRLASPLRFGEISPRQIAWVLDEQKNLKAQAFLRQLGWREFAYYLLHHFPETAHAPLKPLFAQFPWQEDPVLFQAWKTGQTGYPIVDAGMRQLWQTGFLPNRMRMIVASFLVKDLLISWQSGARWFWETLADADLANNTLGWQWVAGCGADASPFFRIFNPISQAKKFDATGNYVRHWVPELAALPTDCLHQPWQANKQQLRSAGITLGSTYPEPIVQHEVARIKALSAYQALKK